MPKRSDTFSPDNESVTKSNFILNLATRIGSEVYAALPEQNRPRRKTNSVKMLLVRSGNPWKLAEDEFLFIRWITAAFGAVIGLGVFFILFIMGISLPWYLFVVGVAVLGFLTPTIFYREKAAERDLTFKQQLPEALDLIVISMSSGSTLQNAIRDSIKNMKPGLLRNEFVSVIKSIDSGRTMKQALDEFADRAPNEGVITFVRSVQEGYELNVDLGETMKARSSASRDELFALISDKVAALPVKMMAILTPTLIGSLLIVLIAPFIVALMEVL